MNENDYTINQVSEILKVSKQCIYKKLNLLKDVLNPHLSIQNGIKYLSEEGLQIINKNLNSNKKLKDLKSLKKFEYDENVIEIFKQQINDLKQQKENLQHELETRVFELSKNHKEQINEIKSSYENQFEHFKKESFEKNKQLESKDKQLENKDKLLENMQVLLKDQKLLLEEKIKKQWWQFWKN